jgi:hypothetical protein
MATVMQVYLVHSASSNYLYNQKGIYNPSLIVKNILGCFDTIQNNTSVTIHGPKAQFFCRYLYVYKFQIEF